MHSRLQVLVEFHTTTGPLPLRVPCCCLDELSSYRSLSPKKLGPPRSLVTLIMCLRASVERQGSAASRHAGARVVTGGCDGRHEGRFRGERGCTGLERRSHSERLPLNGMALSFTLLLRYNT